MPENITLEAVMEAIRAVIRFLMSARNCCSFNETLSEVVNAADEVIPPIIENIPPLHTDEDTPPITHIDLPPATNEPSRKSPEKFFKGVSCGCLFFAGKVNKTNPGSQNNELETPDCAM